MTPQQLEVLWQEHLAGEFVDKDVEATLSTMVEDASVDHIPVHTGGSGKAALRAFYRDVFIPSWPADLKQTPINRVIGQDQVVDELRLEFTHSTDGLAAAGCAADGQENRRHHGRRRAVPRGQNRVRTDLLGPRDRPSPGRLAQRVSMTGSLN